MAADPAAAGLREPVLRALAGHLAAIVRRGRQDGSVRTDVDPEPAAWLLVSLLAAGPLRAQAMPAGYEQAVAELTARLLGIEPPAPGDRRVRSRRGLIGAKRARVSVGNRVAAALAASEGLCDGLFPGQHRAAAGGHPSRSARRG